MAIYLIHLLSSITPYFAVDGVLEMEFHEICENALHPINFNNNLLPTGSEEREVLVVGNTPVAILPSCQHIKTIAL